MRRTISNSQFPTNLLYYRFKDGQEYGKGTISNGNQLPDGQYMPTHAYWLHSKLISDILDKRFIHLKSENDF